MQTFDPRERRNIELLRHNKIVQSVEFSEDYSDVMIAITPSASLVEIVTIINEVIQFRTDGMALHLSEGGQVIINLYG